MDDKHTIVTDVQLANGGELHRFNNPAGEPYSAIYDGEVEMLSCPREKEKKMVKYWNEM